MSFGGPPTGKVGLPWVRSISMNQMFRTWPDDHSKAPPMGSWRIYGKKADMVNPQPANLWVMIDANPDSVNDAAYAMKMDLQGPAASWQGGPSRGHGGGCGFRFADGHSEIRKWKDGRSVSGVMRTTYSTEFPFGVRQANNPDIAWMQERMSAKAR